MSLVHAATGTVNSTVDCIHKGVTDRPRHSKCSEEKVDILVNKIPIYFKNYLLYKHKAVAQTCLKEHLRH